jgi:hypothetical protein
MQQPGKPLYHQSVNRPDALFSVLKVEVLFRNSTTSVIIVLWFSSTSPTEENITHA